MKQIALIRSPYMTGIVGGFLEDVSSTTVGELVPRLLGCIGVSAFWRGAGVSEFFD